jgi:hypothetical protein
MDAKLKEAESLRLKVVIFVDAGLVVEIKDATRATCAVFNHVLVWVGKHREHEVDPFVNGGLENLLGAPARESTSYFTGSVSSHK